jgi:4-hydroxybenzoate polyprenyltransferase
MGKNFMWESIHYRSDKTQHPGISSLSHLGSDIAENIKILRIRHWIKNFLLFAAPFFGGSLFLNETLLMAGPVFLAFSFCASSAYIFNDINDYQKDRLHPDKRKRPIASNRISMTQASLLSVAMIVPSLILSYSIAPTFFYLIIAYIIIQVAYSLHLKNVAMVDIFCIAMGFVIHQGTEKASKTLHLLHLLMKSY